MTRGTRRHVRVACCHGWMGCLRRAGEKADRDIAKQEIHLLTSPEAGKLVQKYTALAETAWISKLAQALIGLRFGWPNGIRKGERKVIIISGGLTGRIRRKYKLNSLLNPDAKSEDEAEVKNRNDDRHHALDAMVISFIPNWARNSKFTGFFRFRWSPSRRCSRRRFRKSSQGTFALKKRRLQKRFTGHALMKRKKSLCSNALSWHHWR